MIVDCLSSLECRSAGRYPVSMPRPHIPATTNCRNTHLVDLPIRSGGFTTTGLLYNLQYKLVNTCLVTLCVARNILRRVKMWETIPATPARYTEKATGSSLCIVQSGCCGAWCLQVSLWLITYRDSRASLSERDVTTFAHAHSWIHRNTKKSTINR